MAPVYRDTRWVRCWRVNYATGDTTYTGGRWGDYSGIQEDPADCGNVWTAQEYGAVGSSGNWDTSLGRFSFDSPFISSVSPHSGPGTGGTIVDIFGFDFVNGGTSVNFGSTPATVFFIDAQHLEAISPPGSGGPVDITATTSNGTTGTSSNDQFTWVPAVSGLSPSAGPTAGGNSVDISGGGFAGATSVHFGNRAASFTVNNDGDITAVAPTRSAGAVHVIVTGPTGTSSSTPSNIYTYDAPPTLTSVSPTSGPAAGGNTVAIKGTNFVPGSTVRFNSTASALVTFVSSTQLKARAPAHPAGPVNVRVTTPGGTTPVVSGDSYTFVPAPTVTSVSPDAGSTAGGNTVTITGTNFNRTATVRFGPTASSAVTFVSTTQLRARAPAQAAGDVNLRVTTAGGISPIVNGSLYAYGIPTISSVTPNAGSTVGGNTVTINGNGFVPGVTVKFGTAAAASLTFVSGTQVKAKAPAHAAGAVSIRVTTAAGISSLGNHALYAFGAPSVSSVSPRSGPVAGGTTVTINGQGFVPGASVNFGTTAAASVSFVSSTKLTAKAPAHAAGSVNIRVSTPGATSATVNGDLYTFS